MKIVINKCFGGFSISREAAEFMAARGNRQAKAELEESKGRWFGYGYTKEYRDGYNRTDPDLVAAIEELGERANGKMAKLAVVEIPDDIEWEIDEYDGQERVVERHRSWS